MFWGSHMEQGIIVTRPKLVTIISFLLLGTTLLMGALNVIVSAVQIGLYTDLTFLLSVVGVLLPLILLFLRKSKYAFLMVFTDFIFIAFLFGWQYHGNELFNQLMIDTIIYKNAFYFVSNSRFIPSVWGPYLIALILFLILYWVTMKKPSFQRTGRVLSIILIVLGTGTLIVNVGYMMISSLGSPIYLLFYFLLSLSVILGPGFCMVSLDVGGIESPYDTDFEDQKKSKHPIDSARKESVAPPLTLRGPYDFPRNQVQTAPVQSNYEPVRSTEISKTKSKSKKGQSDTAEMERSRFTGSTFGLIGINILAGLITLLTAFLLLPVAVCMKQRWYARNTVIDGKQLIFDGNSAQLLGKWIGWIILTAITFGIYSLFLPMRMKKWVTSHTHFR